MKTSKTESALSPAARAGLLALALYKRTLSPVFAHFGARCRHLPTCADYAADAVARHGAWRGAWLATARLCRCHPFGSHGYDPAPQTLGDHRWRPWLYGDWSWRARRSS